MCEAQAESFPGMGMACPSWGWTCCGAYIRDHEGRQGALFCLLPLMPKSCPQIGIF